ncbi:MAG: DUF3619 family protein [Pseudomonadota bacterium]
MSNTKTSNDLSPDDATFAHTLGSELRDAEENLPGDISSRLNQARHAALSAAETKSAHGWRFGGWQKLAGASAFAAVAVLSLVLMQTDPDTLPRMSDEELFAAQDAELLEDLEFLAWVAELETPGA